MQTKKCVIVGLQPFTAQVLSSFLDGKSCEEMYPPGFNFSCLQSEYYKKRQLDDGQEVMLHIFSINPDSFFDQERTKCYTGTDVFIVHFQVNNPSSLDLAITKIVPEIRQCCPNVPILFLGTMSDRRNDVEQEFLRKKCGRGCITKEEGEKKAEEIGAFDYLECSAFLYEGVKEVFDAVFVCVSRKNDNESAANPKDKCVIC